MQPLPPYGTLQKRPSSIIWYGQEDNIQGHSIERSAYWFVLKITRVFPIPTGREGVGWWNLLQYLALSPHAENLEDKTMLVHSKKGFLLPSVWPETEYTLALIWRKSLLVCFESYQGIPYSHTGRVDRMINTLLMVNINFMSNR